MLPVISTNEQGSAYVQMHLNNQTLNLLTDTGAAHAILKSSDVNLPIQNTVRGVGLGGISYPLFETTPTKI